MKKYGDSAWGTSGSDLAQTKVVKVAVESEDSDTAATVNAFAFSNNIPVLRYQAENAENDEDDSNNDQVYVINEGNRATIPSNSLRTGLVTTINFNCNDNNFDSKLWIWNKPWQKNKKQKISIMTPLGNNILI